MRELIVYNESRGDVYDVLWHYYSRVGVLRDVEIYQEDTDVIVVATGQDIYNIENTLIDNGFDVELKGN
tara:strand:- start:1254 stop:1460 length:207 start_codon:yes stop_codon:yes gene_type:complete